MCTIVELSHVWYRKILSRLQLHFYRARPLFFRWRTYSTRTLFRKVTYGRCLFQVTTEKYDCGVYCLPTITTRQDSLVVVVYLKYFTSTWSRDSEHQQRIQYTFHYSLLNMTQYADLFIICLDYLPMESTTIALGCVLLSLNTSRLFEPLVVISAMMPWVLSV